MPTACTSKSWPGTRPDGSPASTSSLSLALGAGTASCQLLPYCHVPFILYHSRLLIHCRPITSSTRATQRPLYHQVLRAEGRPSGQRSRPPAARTQTPPWRKGYSSALSSARDMDPSPRPNLSMHMTLHWSSRRRSSWVAVASPRARRKLWTRGRERV